MHTSEAIEIVAIDPRTPSIAALVHELDRYMGGLYPAESNHLLDIDTLAGSDVRFFAAFAGEDAVGCGAIMLKKGYAEVKRIYVSPEARGLGLGRLMLQRLEEEARALGVALMRLETGTLQPEALSLFSRRGFVRCGPFGEYPADDPYSVFMEKRL
ncbi:MAG: GNAT family N-acetyltransferase [Hyphomicrobiales bacterium]